MNTSFANLPTSFLAKGWWALHRCGLAASLRQFPVMTPEGKQQSVVYHGYAYTMHLFPILEALKIYSTGYFVDENQEGQLTWIKLRKFIREHDPGAWQAVSKRQSTMSLLARYTDWASTRQSATRKKFDPNIPADVARYGWKLIQNASQGKQIRVDLLAWGIALIGWVAHLYEKLRHCPACFRWAGISGRYCRMHSLAGTSAGTSSQRYMRYRAAREITLRQEAIQAINERIGFEMLDHFQFEAAHLNRILFNPGFSENESRMLHNALAECPEVLALLGGKKIFRLSPDRFFHLLQDKVDPLEVTGTGFFLKLVMYERWLDVETSVTPGVRGKGRIARIRVAQASKLAAEGVRPTEIAKALKVSRSAVANWRRRYPEFGAAFSAGRGKNGK